MKMKQLTIALIAAGFGLALGAGFNRIDTHVLGTANAAVSPPAVAAPVAPTAAARLPDFTALVDRVGPAVVNISTVGTTKTTGFGDEFGPDNPFNEFFKRFGGPGFQVQPQIVPMRGEGSGFIVSPDGYIVTNAHVVDGASQVTVKLTDRREFTAKVVGADKRTDIALLKIAATNLPAVDLSNPPSVKPGQWVIAIGSPFGFENSVSAGIVSGVHRALPGGQMTPFIQTDVAVNPGNSGGPLLNAAGQVVGVNSQIYSRSGGFMGLSFAIPAKVAENVAQQLKAHGKVSHGRLGIGIQGLDQTLAESFGLPDSNGALVGSVEKGSPADKAGFKTGDIIRKIDNVAVTDSTDVTSRIGNMAPGKKIDVEIWRDRKPMTLTATIGSWGGKEQVASAGTSDASHGNKLGVAVRPLTPDEKREIGHDGLVVENASGPAADAGIQPGDVIVRVGATKVTTIEGLRHQIDKAGKNVALLIERNGQQIFVPVKVG
ncbi:MAG: Do family serine endopeptidase [Betaproteobacteria bacterium]|nr:Do family serine endopeptidase [Betaproteobacteria bacterium]MDE2208193.1 Do family serine endopeptidase [Betaproteobacteria bacterium]MDE2358180.1 Do family serine endopeptidase [Betaproteobacteria bacterium]